jgi:predicted metalloprotease with PDZ domain
MRFQGLLSLATLAAAPLVASPLLAQESPALRLTIEVDSVDVAIALQGPAVVALAEEIRATADGAFAFGVDLFGSLPEEFGEGPYEEITITIVEGADRRGESEPARVDMTMPAPEEELDHLLWKGVLTHEIFHLWNAEGFRYASVEEQWLSEGFTQYYTLRALGRMGALDEPTFLFVLGRLLGMYLADPGLGSISMREAGPVKQEHTGLVEGGGLAVALCLDVELRTAGAGKSIDDVMRLLFARHDAADRRYALDDVMAYVAEIGGEDRSAFFGEYVAGTATLPLDDCLAPAGLTLSFEGDVARVEMVSDPSESQLRLLNALRGL